MLAGGVSWRGGIRIICHITAKAKDEIRGLSTTAAKCAAFDRDDEV
jgi:hypothetical protein